MSLPSLGIKEIFGSTADLSGISSDEGLKLSEVSPFQQYKKTVEDFYVNVFFMSTSYMHHDFNKYFHNIDVFVCIYYTLYGTVQRLGLGYMILFLCFWKKFLIKKHRLH